MTLTEHTTTAVPPSSCCDPRVAALLDAADAHVAHIDAVLLDNELRMRELVAA